MGRVFDETRVNGHSWWTIFDSGASNSYLTASAARSLKPKPLPNPFTARIGGRSQKIKGVCEVMGSVQGKPVVVQAFVLPRLGQDPSSGRTIDFLFGALAMKQWGIELNLKKEKLDLSHYSREFVEF